MENRTITVGNRTLPITSADERRFWSKVDKSGPGECWAWAASLYSGTGYGQFTIKDNQVLAHRVAYALVGHTLDKDLVIDHLCHTRNCVNPAHLRQVTKARNFANRAGLNTNNASGVRGVYWHAQRSGWYVQVTLHRHRHFGGLHTTLDSAELAAINLRIELGMANSDDFERRGELEDQQPALWSSK